jgi:biopolymer transport protein ExbB/TolQ
MTLTTAWYRDGGPVMHVIAVVGLIGLAIFFERLYTIVIRSKTNGRRFIERVIQLVRAGRVDEAIKECAGAHAAVPDMGLLILRSRSRDEADLENVADAASLAVLPILTRRLNYLPAIATAVVLLGLVGTIASLQHALSATAVPATPERTIGIAAGIAAALNPTGFGLAIAAALVVGRAYLVSQSELIIEQIHEFSARLINALIDRPDVRLGHR